MSNGIRYNHDGSGYFTKSELLSIEVSVHHTEDFDSILDQAVKLVARTIFTNETILESLKEVPELEVLPTELDNLGEINRASAEVNIILMQTELLEPIHHNELDSINFQVQHNDVIVSEEIIITPHNPI